MNLADYAPSYQVTEHAPDLKADARRLLSNVRGETDGTVRLVRMRRSEHEKFIVRGPRDGRPLLIDAWRGLARLVIESGTVIVHADSAWGNAVVVQGDAHVTVITTSRRKLSAEVQDAGTLIVHAAPESHGYLHTRSADATITVNGAGHRFTVRTVDGITRTD